MLPCLNHGSHLLVLLILTAAHAHLLMKIKIISPMFSWWFDNARNVPRWQEGKEISFFFSVQMAGSPLHLGIFRAHFLLYTSADIFCTSVTYLLWTYLTIRAYLAAPYRWTQKETVYHLVYSESHMTLSLGLTILTLVLNEM